MDKDRLHKERINRFMKKLDDDGEFDENLFVSELVNKTITEPKNFLRNFDTNKILSYLPYYDTLYVSVCPACIDDKNYHEFKTLVERGAIIPTLIAPYSKYDDKINDLVYARDHINFYEYSAFRYYSIMAASGSGVCRHCVNKWENSTSRIFTRRTDLLIYKPQMQRLLQNLYPFVMPDADLLREFRDALKTGDERQIALVSNLGAAVHAIRSSQVFNSPLGLTDIDLINLPDGITDETDEAIEIASQTRMSVAEGLGIRIPTDVPLEQFLEIIEDYRPYISSVVEFISSRGRADSTEQLIDIQKSVININSEIERIRKSRRQIVIEAFVDFYGKNATLINAALMAGAVGVGESLAGCAVLETAVSGVGGAIVSVAASVAKRKKWVKGGVQTERFKRKFSSELRPLLDRVIALYLGASLPAVNVISLKRGISNSARSRST